MRKKSGFKKIGDLRAAIAASGTDPVILVWIRAKPRVTTMRPVAAELLERGFNVHLAYSPAMKITPEDMKIPAHVPCYAVKVADLPALEGVAVFLTSEQDTGDGPLRSRRVGIHHSMPDQSLRRNHSAMLAPKPVAVLATDYYAILVKQSEEHWTPENYTPFVDEMLPASLLEHRRPNLAIIPFGYPKIDQMMARDTDDTPLDTITYAPTQTLVGFGRVLKDGTEILSMLLEKFPDYKIAFRPYPGADVKKTRDVYAPFLDHPRFSLDDSATGEALMQRTALMVTDRSSVAVSFGLGMARPVISYNSDGVGKNGQGELVKWPPIGQRAGSLEALHEGVRKLLKNADGMKKQINKRRGDFLHNPGGSIAYLAEVMPDIIADNTRPEWLEVPRRPFPGKTLAENRAQYHSILERIERTNPRGVPLIEKVIKPGFEVVPPSLIRSLAQRTLQRIPGLRRYLSRPTDRM